jgi:thermostable 8-oxoguanine DNA glycosylase
MIFIFLNVKCVDMMKQQHFLLVVMMVDICVLFTHTNFLQYQHWVHGVNVTKCDKNYMPMKKLII